MGIWKRLKDSARPWGSPGALGAVSSFISDLRQEAKHIPVAERVMRAPSKEKEHTVDINFSRPFFMKHLSCAPSWCALLQCIVPML